MARIGYIIASNEVMLTGKPIRYIYRESPDSADDSGWRVFSGEESQEYADNPLNFAMYNAATIVEKEPRIAKFLGEDYPVEYQWNVTLERFERIADE